METGLVLPAPPTGRRAAGSRLFDAMVANGSNAVLRLAHEVLFAPTLCFVITPLGRP